MAITKATSSVLADNAALNNLNAGASIAFTKPVSVSGNLTVDTNTLFVNAANDRVGIGTTTPTFKLQLSGASTLGIDTAGSEPAIVGGAAGILLKVSSGAASIFRGLDGWTGTWIDSAPTTYFQVGRASGNTMFSSSVGQSFSRLSFTVSNTTNNGVVFTTEAGSLSSPVGYFEIRQGSTPNFLVQKTTGNIGIGTSTPNEKLTVVGDISATGNISASGNITASNLVYTTGDQTIAGLKTFSDNIVGNGTANRLPNQLAVASSDIITKGLADSRYTSRNERITDDNTFLQTTWEQFLDFDDQYNQDLIVSAASGAGTFGVAPGVFGDTWVAGNVSTAGFTGNDLYTHRGVFLVRGPTGSNQSFFIGINRTTIPYFLTNRIDEFTSRVFITGADFATQGYFKVGPIQKGGTGGGDASLVGGLMFNPFLHPTNLVLGVNKSTTVTPFTFTTTAANVDFLDTGFNFTDLLFKWVNVTYKIDRAVGPTITIIISRDNVVLFQDSYNTATHPTVSTWVRKGSLHTTGASNEIGLQSGHFTYTAPNRSQLFIDYLHYKVTGTSAAPSNWNSLRF